MTSSIVGTWVYKKSARRYWSVLPRPWSEPKNQRYLTIILRNRAEYHLILSRRGRRPSWLNQGIFRKIEQDNCFIIQQIPIDYHFQNEKNYGSMINIGPQCAQNRRSVGSSWKQSKQGVRDCRFNNIQASATASCSKSA